MTIIPQMKDSDLPADKDAEQAILGATILNNDLIKDAALMLADDDFYYDSHRRIFAAMKRLHARGQPIDLVTLGSCLKATGELARAGGAAAIGALIDGVPRTDTIVYYARIVKRKAAARALYKTSYQAMQRIEEGDDDLESVIEEVRASIDPHRLSLESDTPKLSGYLPLSSFMESTFERPEEILCGLHRGEVGGLLAITNYGKSTLLYNTSLALSAGEICGPLAVREAEPRRVLYLDFETPAAGLQDDLRTMLENVGARSRQIARDNFHVVVDASVGEEPLCLSRPSHFEMIVELARKIGADLVVVDTAASAFELVDENSNAEVTRKIMKPLKRLAIEANCAVVFTHHIGKSNETQSAEAAYRGRGASAFGALSRATWNLERDQTKGPGYIKVSCSKVKGVAFEPALLKLDFALRWFFICAEVPAPERRSVTVQDIADYVESTAGEVTQKELVRAFDKWSRPTVVKRIEEAARIGLIIVSTRGRYVSPGPLSNYQTPIESRQFDNGSENGSGNGHKPANVSNLDEDLSFDPYLAT